MWRERWEVRRKKNEGVESLLRGCKMSIQEGLMSDDGGLECLIKQAD
jgi:hypothetical protein